jgi:hypothetical protein
VLAEPNPGRTAEDTRDPLPVPEEARGLIERHPEIAPLGETGVITLAREGFRWIQMASIVRTVQAGTTAQQ